jgi:DNA-binding CsgD family transcriptional regulator
MQKELTRQEQKILNLLVDGISPKDIAYKLNISNRTVEFHRTNIYNKLGVHSVQELLAKHKSSEQSTETASSAEPEAAPSANVKNRKLERLIPFGLGILIGVVSMLFVWWIFMKPHESVTFDIVYLRASRWTGEEAHGENYNSEDSIKFSDIYPAGIDKFMPVGGKETREILISGTIDKELKYAKINFSYVANEPDSNGRTHYYVGGSGYQKISQGDFLEKFTVRRALDKPISELPPGKVIIEIIDELSNINDNHPEFNVESGERIPDDIRDGAIMATIRNLRIKPIVR